MIVRILEDGQYDLPEAAAEELHRLDLELDRSIREGDEVGFTATLAAVVDEVHAAARKLGSEAIVPSDLTIPAAGSSLDEVRRLLADGNEEH
jgi:hypothetical protein